MTDKILLGIDYGKTNIGLAFGRKGIAAPLEVISAKDVNSALAKITKIVIQDKISKIIVGLPLDREGKETMQSKEVRRFTKLLKMRVNIPVEFFDEHSSSMDAMQGAIALGIPQKRRRMIDDIAAAKILERYFEENS